MKWLLRNHTHRSLVVAKTPDALFVHLNRLREEGHGPLHINLLRVPDDHPEVHCRD